MLPKPGSRLPSMAELERFLAMTRQLPARRHITRACVAPGHRSRALAAGGSALDAATKAVVALEDDPLFNAGRGSVFTAAGTQEMDASVMDGTDHRAGGVAGIFGPRNLALARARCGTIEPRAADGRGCAGLCREQGIVFAEPQLLLR
jgi:beta-aspartyl-peptidase (threonine type)